MTKFKCMSCRDTGLVTLLLSVVECKDCPSESEFSWSGLPPGILWSYYQDSCSRWWVQPALASTAEVRGG